MKIKHKFEKAGEFSRVLEEIERVLTADFSGLFTESDAQKSEIRTHRDCMGNEFVERAYQLVAPNPDTLDIDNLYQIRVWIGSHVGEYKFKGQLTPDLLRALKVKDHEPQQTAEETVENNENINIKKDETNEENDSNNNAE